MSKTRIRCQEAFHRDEILRSAFRDGRFEPQRGQSAIAKRMWKAGLLEPVVGCSEVYRITATGRAELE